jgi:putative hydrolase of the HAD superfamily
MPELRAVLFDFGGVLSTSPFDAFSRYEREHGLPEGFIRTVNATNPDANAWALLERGSSSMVEFDARFRAEANALGHDVAGADVLALLMGDLRPQMVEAVRRCKQRFATALLTNNFVGMGGFGHDGPRDPAIGAVLELFDVIIESSVVGVRKPDPRFYEMACEQLGIEPHEALFLDDLGINLKPARELGMTTIKVVTADQALADLEAATGLSLR